MRFASALFCLIYLSLANSNSLASDLEREKRLADQIVDSIMDGEPTWLEAGAHRFLAIDMAPDAVDPKGGVIVMHGRGFHPDWEDVARPLRIGLAEQGWRTLALQMPVLGKSAKYFDYLPILPESFPRIEAGIKYLHQQGLNKIILIAHSCSVHSSLSWASATGAPGIDAFVGIGMGATDYKQPMPGPLPLNRLSVPVLDVFGSEDYPAVLDLADRRLMNIAAGGRPESRQIMVRGANHYFHERDQELIQVISAWLDETGF